MENRINHPFGSRLDGVRRSVPSAEWERRQRAWVASGGPARAAALRMAHGKPPAPPALVLRWATCTPTTRPAVTPVSKLRDRARVIGAVETKAQRRARARAITSAIDSTLWVEDMKMIVRARKALANTGASRSARAFESSGDPGAFE